VEGYKCSLSFKEHMHKDSTSFDFISVCSHVYLPFFIFKNLFQIKVHRLVNEHVRT